MIILSTGSLHTYGLTRIFGLTAKTGFDGVEVLIDGRMDTYDATYLRRLSSEWDLPIVALHTPFVPAVRGWPSDQLGRLKHTLNLANRLDVPIVVAHLPVRLCGITCQLNFLGNRSFFVPLPWYRKGPYYDLLRDGRLRELELHFGATIALENMPARHFLGVTINAYSFNRPDDLARFHHLTLDTTHLATWGFDPVEIYERLKPRIAHVHLSNFDGTEHRLPTDGRLPLAKLLRRLAHAGYAGMVSVETTPDALEAEDETRCVAALKRTLAFCRQHLRGQGQGRVVGLKG